MRLIMLLVAVLLGAAPAVAGPRVVTDIPAVHSIAAAVMEGAGAPKLLVPAGASPHDHALRPSEAEALAGADLVVWIGPDLTPWLDRALGTMAGDAISLPLLDRPETFRLGFREGAVFADHDHDHGGTDPHAWLDPQNAAIWAKVIAATLSEIDPENAALYKSNAGFFWQDMADLRDRIDGILAPHRGKKWITFHDAFHYFEHRFDIESSGAIAVSDGTAPSAARVAKIRNYIQNQDVSCVFSEPQFGSRMAGTVTEGTEARTGFLDPVGVKIDAGSRLYTELMLRLAHDLAACLGAG